MAGLGQRAIADPLTVTGDAVRGVGHSDSGRSKLGPGTDGETHTGERRLRHHHDEGTAMATYRVTELHGRMAVFDQYGRCVELLPAGTSQDEIAATVTAQHRAREYVADDLITQQTFDPETQEWSQVKWPVPEA